MLASPAPAHRPTRLVICRLTYPSLIQDDWKRVFSEAQKNPSKELARQQQQHRDLNFTLQLELLLKLKQAASPLEAMLMHPQAQAAISKFVVPALYGVLRPPAFNAACALLRPDGIPD